MRFKYIPIKHIVSGQFLAVLKWELSKMGAIPYKKIWSVKRWEPYHIKQFGALRDGSPTVRIRMQGCVFLHSLFDYYGEKNDKIRFIQS